MPDASAKQNKDAVFRSEGGKSNRRQQKGQCDALALAQLATGFFSVRSEILGEDRRAVATACNGHVG